MLQIEFDGVKALSWISGVHERGSNLNKLYEITIPEIKKDIGFNFDKRTNPDGKPWKDTIRRTRKPETKPPILWGKGGLFRDTQDSSNYKIESGNLNVFTKHLGGTTHQFGITHNIWKNPRPYPFAERKFAGISKEGFASIREKTGNYILNATV